MNNNFLYLSQSVVTQSTITNILYTQSLGIVAIKSVFILYNHRVPLSKFSLFVLSFLWCAFFVCTCIFVCVCVCVCVYTELQVDPGVP